MATTTEDNVVPNAGSVPRFTRWTSTTGSRLTTSIRPAGPIRGRAALQPGRDRRRRRRVGHALGAAWLGAKVALVEKYLLGGDCLNVGARRSRRCCAAGAYADVRDSGEFGVRVPQGARVDFPAVMERMRRLR